MSDTIDLPAFGLTLERDHTRGMMWHLTEMDARAYASFDGVWWYASVAIRRDLHTWAEYNTYRADDLGVAAARLLAQMTPDDVAAIRALGER